VPLPIAAGACAVLPVNPVRVSVLPLQTGSGDPVAEVMTGAAVTVTETVDTVEQTPSVPFTEYTYVPATLGLTTIDEPVIGEGNPLPAAGTAVHVNDV